MSYEVELHRNLNWRRFTILGPDGRPIMSWITDRGMAEYHARQRGLDRPGNVLVDCHGRTLVRFEWYGEF